MSSKLLKYSIQACGSSVVWSEEAGQGAAFERANRVRVKAPFGQGSDVWVAENLQTRLGVGIA